MALRAAVVGCGSIAHEHLAFLLNTDAADVVAVFDQSAVLTNYIGQRYGVTQATSFDQLLTAFRPDVVHILTPPSSHAAIISECLERNIHVICEKPAAPDYLTTQRLIDQAKTSGCHFIESHNYRFNKTVQEALDCIATGTLGTVNEVDILMALPILESKFADENLKGPSVNLGAGAIHDFLPHLTYLWCALSGVSLVGPQASELSVSGYLVNRSGNSRVGFDTLDVVIMGKVRGRLRFAPDVLPDAFRIAVRGTEGSFETDLFNPFVRREGLPNIKVRSSLEQLRSGASLAKSGVDNLFNKVTNQGPLHGLHQMLDDTYSALSTGQTPPVTPQHMLDSAKLIDLIVELGKP